MRLLSTILALLMPLALLAQVKETVLYEDFADNRAGWPEDITEVFSASVNDGTYYLSHKRSTGSKCFDIPVKMFLGDNYYIETVARLRSGRTDGGYGIVWGKGKGGYFSYVITASGRFFVRELRHGRQGEYLLGPRKCDHIHKTGSNKIRVQYANDEIMFFINDKYVGHIPNRLYYGNDAGIILYGQQNVDVSSFGAFGTKNYEKLKDYHGAMRVISYEIEDGEDTDGERLGNGDCRISPGETIRLAVTLKNQGYGTYSGLRVKFYAVSGYVTVIDQDVAQYLNNIDRYSTQVLDLKFKVSQACRAEKLEFKLDITDTLDRLAESVTMPVMLNTSIPPINKDGRGTLSFTFNLREKDYGDINTAAPITLNNGNNTYAVIVGVESYMSLPKAKYATNDAKIFYRYLVKVLNLPRDNIIYAINQKATLKDVGDIFKVGGQLYYKVYNRPGVDLIVYFSGLGICDNGGTEPYLLLYDSKANSPRETAYPLSSLLRSLRGFRANSLMCFFDTSFAGVDRDGQPVSGANSTLRTSVSFPVVADNTTCLMYASGGGQLNPVVDNTSHGMFTHYLIATLLQYADERETLDMKHLYENIYQSMEREGKSRSINLFPRMDCINQDGIRLLK